MHKFYYRAKTISGKVITGVCQADNEQSLMSTLTQKGLFILQIKRKFRLTLDLTLFEIFNKINAKDISLLSKQLYILTSSGIPIIVCLQILIEQEKNNKMMDALKCIYQEIQKGRYLSQAMYKKKEIFPQMFISMIEAGEVSGNLDETFEWIHKYYEREYKIKKRMRNIMIYPLFVLATSVIVIIFLLISVVPMFVNIFERFGQQLPYITRVVITISNLLVNYWVYIILTILGLSFAVYKGVKNNIKIKANIDRLKLSIPVYKSIIKKIIIYKFTISLARLLKSGIPLNQSLNVIEKILDNQVYKQGVKKTINYIQQGITLSKALKNLNIFPPIVIQMIKTGEESGKLDEILFKIADFYEDETETALKGFTAIMEPIVIIILSIIVGFIVLSIACPMLNLYNFTF